MRKIAIVLYGFGGAPSLDGVRSFIANIFNDYNIIPLPYILRKIISFFISSLRYKKVQSHYADIGGRSPVIEMMTIQAKMLEDYLSDLQLQTKSTSSNTFKVFIAARYSEPYPLDIIDDLISYGPDKIILLPTYPQYSHVTTGSFLRFWTESVGIRCRNFIPIMEYHSNHFLITAYCDLITNAMQILKNKKIKKWQLLIVAHGIPEEIRNTGDPYEAHIINSTQLIIQQLPKDIDYIVCYQSRVGRMKWLSPYIENVILSAGNENKSLIILPISFTSENLETLWELDIQYKKLASDAGVPYYIRVPALNNHPLYIKCLADVVSSCS